MSAFYETKLLYECTLGEDSPINNVGKIVLSPILFVTIVSFFMLILMPGAIGEFA